MLWKFMKINGNSLNVLEIHGNSLNVVEIH